MASSLQCPRCGGTFLGERDAIGFAALCPVCRREAETSQNQLRTQKEAEAECSNCGQLFPLSKLSDHKGSLFCSRCFNILSRKEVQQARRKKRIAIEIFVLIVAAVGFYFAKDFIFSWKSYTYEIAGLDSSVDHAGNLFGIEASVQKKSDSQYDEYALICSIDSNEDITMIAERLIDEARKTETGPHHLARWSYAARSEHCFLGTYGKGSIQWIDNSRRFRRSGSGRQATRDGNGYVCWRDQWINPCVTRCGNCIDKIGIHIVVLCGVRVPENTKLNLYEVDFGQFKTKGEYIVKAQVWCRSGKKWEPASKVCEHKYSK